MRVCVYIYKLWREESVGTNSESSPQKRGKNIQNICLFEEISDLFEETKRRFFKKQFTHAFFFVNTLTDEQSLRFPTNPRNAVWLFRRRGVVIASSPSRERTETFITREERTRCVLHIVVYVRRASRDEMRRGKATAQLPFFFWDSIFSKFVAQTRLLNFLFFNNIRTVFWNFAKKSGASVCVGGGVNHAFVLREEEEEEVYKRGVNEVIVWRVIT